MQFTTSLLALAALSTSVLAGPHHRHFHQKKSPMPEVFEALAQRVASAAPAASPSAAAAPAASPSAAAAAVPAASPQSSSTTSSVGSIVVDAVSALESLGAKSAVNSQTNNGGIWIGSDGAFVNNFVNSASQAIVLVVWGSQGSWVNAVAPQVAVTIPAGGSTQISFANGQSGAWAGIYEGTSLVNGQIANTWGEFTFSDPYSTVDVSREVNMNGNGMSIQTPNCLSNMNTCVFVCPSGQSSCWLDYSLENCANGSQQGAQYGTYNGAASGGCGGFKSGDKITTTFSD